MSDDRRWNVETKYNFAGPDEAREFFLAQRELAQTMGGTPLESHVHPHPRLALVEDEPRGAA